MRTARKRPGRVRRQLGHGPGRLGCGMGGRGGSGGRKVQLREHVLRAGTPQRVQSAPGLRAAALFLVDGGAADVRCVCLGLCSCSRGRGSRRSQQRRRHRGGMARRGSGCGGIGGATGARAMVRSWSEGAAPAGHHELQHGVGGGIHGVTAAALKEGHEERVGGRRCQGRCDRGHGPWRGEGRGGAVMMRPHWERARLQRLLLLLSGGGRLSLGAQRGREWFPRREAV